MPCSYSFIGGPLIASPLSFIEHLESLLLIRVRPNWRNKRWQSSRASSCNDRVARFCPLRFGFVHTDKQFQEPRSGRRCGSKLQGLAIGSFSVFGGADFNLAVGLHSFQRCMTCGEWVREIIEIKPRFFQRISYFNCGQLLRVNSQKQGAYGVSQVRSSIVQQGKQLRYLLLFLPCQSYARLKKSHGLFKSGNFGIEKIAPLNTLCQISNRFIKSLNVFIRRHKLCLNI